MSHFTVIVAGEDHENQLAPFHEYECTGNDNEYVIDVDVTDKYLEYHKKYADKDQSFESYVKSDGLTFRNGRAWDHTNPNAKWDWYQIGGRWTGYFKPKPDANIETCGVGEPGLMTEPATNGFVDQIKKGDIDLDFMFSKAKSEAIKQHDKLQEATSGLEIPPPWDEFREKHNDIDLARDLWSKNRWIKAIRNAGLWDDTEFRLPREEYIQNKTWASITPFAYVQEQKWYEKGERGWWGMVSDEKDQSNWTKQFNQIFKSLPDETTLTLVDCHI